jgi:hypothetical protein
MIRNPVIFGEESMYLGSNTYKTYNRTDFKTLCSDVTYMEIDAKGREVRRDFFEQWLKDKTKRSYKQLDFVPSHDENQEFYNTFQGFDCEINEFDYTTDENAIEIFKKHLGVLTNHCEKSIEYLLSWCADLIQNPARPPGVAILFKSEQGFGKDMFVDFISKMIGKDFICRTQDVKNVLGDFNSLIKDKIVVQLDELSGKDGWAFREKLKGLITTKDININEKGLKQYTQRSSLRVVLSSNRNSPIEISPDDRRFVVFRADPAKPNYQYFDRLGSVLDCDNSIYSIYNYLKQYKIKINLRTDRPITEAYSQMRENNIDPLYRFMHDLFVNDNINEHFSKYENEYISHKKTNCILIPNQLFFDKYNDYVVDNQYEFTATFKKIKQLLNEIGTDYKKYKIGGQVKRCYAFNKEKIIIAITNMNITDDIIEIHDEDLE